MKFSVQGMYDDYSTDTRGFDFDEEPQAHCSSFDRIEKVREHGRFRRAIPSMPLELACICFLVNICIPGLGTIISAFSVISCADGALNDVGINIGAGLLQLLTAPLIFGIIWSWQWAWLFIVLNRQWWRRIDERTTCVDACFCASC